MSEPKCTCGACAGALSGPGAPFPRCVPCGHWEDECECDMRWSYEAEVHEDLGGSDVVHHVVCGDRHVAEVETEEDAHLIVAAVNAMRYPPASSTPTDAGERP